MDPVNRAGKTASSRFKITAATSKKSWPRQLFGELQCPLSSLLRAGPHRRIEVGTRGGGGAQRPPSKCLDGKLQGIRADMPKPFLFPWADSQETITEFARERMESAIEFKLEQITLQGGSRPDPRSDSFGKLGGQRAVWQSPTCSELSPRLSFVCSHCAAPSRRPSALRPAESIYGSL